MKVYPSSLKIKNHKGKHSIRSNAYVKSYHALNQHEEKSTTKTITHHNIRSLQSTFFYIPPDNFVQRNESPDDKSDTTIPFADSNSSWDETDNQAVVQRPKHKIWKPERYRDSNDNEDI